MLNDTDLQVDPVRGYRMFEVDVDGLHSIAQPYLWTPGENEALCFASPKVSRGRSAWRNGPDGLERVELPDAGHGRIPDPSCGCGFWIYASENVARDRLMHRPTHPHASRYGDFGGRDVVLAEVDGSGRIIEGEDGWRCEYAQIVALVTDVPDLFAAALEKYSLVAVLPRTPEEEGIVPDAHLDHWDDGDPIRVLVLRQGKHYGTWWYLADPAIRPQLVALGEAIQVSIRFELHGEDRWITRIERRDGS